jgi:hypothetical protein
MNHREIVTRGRETLFANAEPSLCWLEQSPTCKALLFAKPKFEFRSKSEDNKNFKNVERLLNRDASRDVFWLANQIWQKRTRQGVISLA